MVKKEKKESKKSRKTEKTTEKLVKSSKRKNKKEEDYEITEDDINLDDENNENNENEEESEVKISNKTKERLKKKINGWLDCDDKIKATNAKLKKYKDMKKQQEKEIMTIIEKMDIEGQKFDVKDENDQLRGRVYCHVSVTKGALKEELIKEALMLAIGNEKKVNYLVKKIESKRPVNERKYLKRTKGNK